VCRCFYEPPKTYDEEGRKKAVSTNTKAVLENLLEILGSCSEDVEDIKGRLHEYCEEASKSEKNIKMREIMMPLRMAMVGSLSGLDISFIISSVGIKESCNRISSFIKTV